MATTKQDYNAACERLQRADHQIGKLTHQILQARVRALDCKRRVDQMRVLPGDVSLDDHAAAAAGIAADFAKLEGERRYWAHYHAQLMEQIVDARNEAAAAKQMCREVMARFWRDRWGEQVRGFFDSNRRVLSDMYGTFARLTESTPSGREFWGSLLQSLPDIEIYKGGLLATEKVIPSSLPETEHLRSIDSAEHNSPSTRAEFLRVGPKADPDHVEDLKARIRDTESLISENAEKVAVARKKVEAAEGVLSDTREQAKGARYYDEDIAALESAARVARHELKVLEEKGRDLTARRMEQLDEVREAEDELAKLEAVKVS